MSQIKAYIPEIATIVGIQASLLLNHIKYWSETKKVEKVYRTNKQLSEDFKGTLSESQIQRAKKKLVDNGLIIVSHDMGHTRTTHYTLTEKAKSLLGMVVDVIKKVVKSVKQKVTRKPVSPNENQQASCSQEMKKQFKQGVANPSAVPMPEESRNKLIGLIKSKPSPSSPSPVEDIEDNVEDDYDDYFKAIDIGLELCNEPKQQDLSFTELLSKAFRTVPNIDKREENRMMLEQSRQFKEDY